MPVGSRGTREPMPSLRRFIDIVRSKVGPASGHLRPRQRQFEAEESLLPLVGAGQDPLQQLCIAAVRVTLGTDPIPPKGLPNGDYCPVTRIRGGDEAVIDLANLRRLYQ